MSFSLVIIFLLNNFIFAALSQTEISEKVKLEDRIISSTFKALAKIFISTLDINKLKKNNIKRLNNMNEDKFKKQYARVYQTLKDYPLLLVRYDVTENMTRDALIEKIKSLDKRQMYEMADSVPDKVIANQFKQYLNKKRQELQNGIANQINQLWGKIIEKAK